MFYFLSEDLKAGNITDDYLEKVTACLASDRKKPEFEWFISRVASVVVSLRVFNQHITKRTVSRIVTPKAEGYALWVLENYWDAIKNDVQEDTSPQGASQPTVGGSGGGSVSSATDEDDSSSDGGTKKRKLGGRYNSNQTNKLHKRTKNPRGVKVSK